MNLPDAVVKLSWHVYVLLPHVLFMINVPLAFSSLSCPFSQEIAAIGCPFGSPGSNDTRMLPVGSNVYTFSTTLRDCGMYMIGLSLFYSGSCVVRLAVFNSTGPPHTRTGSASLRDRKFLQLPAKANGSAYLVNFSTPSLLPTGTSRVDLTLEDAGFECLIMSRPVHGDQACSHPWQVTVYNRNEQHWRHQKYEGLLNVAVVVQDADECELKVHDCESKTTVCVNTLYSFRCRCKRGYQECVTVDGCNSTSRCGDAGQRCNNTDGSFSRCQRGYHLLNSSCHDVDECKVANSCAPGLQCKNLLGSFTCSCQPGNSHTDGECENQDPSVLSSDTPTAAATSNTGHGYTSVPPLNLFFGLIVVHYS